MESSDALRYQIDATLFAPQTAIAAFLRESLNNFRGLYHMVDCPADVICVAL